MNSNRREFIKKTILAGVATGFSAKSYGKIIGANDRVRVACVGFCKDLKLRIFHLLSSFKRK